MIYLIFTILGLVRDLFHNKTQTNLVELVYVGITDSGEIGVDFVCGNELRQNCLDLRQAEFLHAQLARMIESAKTMPIEETNDQERA